MYKTLDHLISAETTEDSWYDDGCVIAGEILAEFSQQDWEELANEVLSKPLEWQKKLAYCLDSTCTRYEVQILVAMLSTKDPELFEICIDTLRSFTSPESKQMILADPSILQQVRAVLPKASTPVKLILEDFIRKFHS